MKPVFVMLITSTDLNSDETKVRVSAYQTDSETNHAVFEIDTQDAVLFPVGTKISVTVESLEA